MSRRANGSDGQRHPEEALSREQAIRFYTANDAYLVFLDEQVGSLEVGKLAEPRHSRPRNLLTCPLDDIKDAQVVATYLGGKQVFPRP